MESNLLSRHAAFGIDKLRDDDPELFRLIGREHRRQSETLAMIAAASVAAPSVTACEGTMLGNVTTEGYPGARFHAGGEIIDEIERLAISRAKSAFGAQYANVQPHSGSTANSAVLFSLLKPGDTVLGMDLKSGGHLTHGSRASVSGRVFNAVGYGTDESGRIDYAVVEALAKEHRPRVIICGASSYPRSIDFEEFRRIADTTGAILLADISHIAGLVVAGLHSSPIDVAHITTTSTYKQLYGPRGGLILMGQDFQMITQGSKRTLSEVIQHGVFPLVQGTPQLQAIAAKGRALLLASGPDFRLLAQRILTGAEVLATSLSDAGYDLVTGGTDNHMVVVDLTQKGISGLVAEEALESCGIIVNRNLIAGDPRGPRVTSGLRLGTNILAARKMDADAVRRSARLVDGILSAVSIDGPHKWHLEPDVQARMRDAVASLCHEYPLQWGL